MATPVDLYGEKFKINLFNIHIFRTGNGNYNACHCFNENNFQQALIYICTTGKDKPDSNKGTFKYHLHG